MTKLTEDVLKEIELAIYQGLQNGILEYKKFIPYNKFKNEYPVNRRRK